MDVNDAISNLKHSNSMNIYALNCEIIKYLEDSKIQFSDACVCYGILPREFKIRKVVPIFKKGLAADVNNYRPVLIMPVLGNQVLERYNLLCPSSKSSGQYC